MLYKKSNNNIRTCQYSNSNIHWSVAEFTRYVAWFYYGYDGQLYPDTQFTELQSVPVLELHYDDNLLDKYPIPYENFYKYYKICRKHKRNKPSQLIFEMDLVDNLVKLCHEVNNMTYKQSTSIVFIITQPKPREVIAADFRDRIVQTIIVQKLQTYFEEYMHKDSYSCRVGKGGLKAALNFRDYLKRVSNNFTEDCYVYSLDFKSFFMSIDTNIWTDRLLNFAKEKYHGKDEKLLYWLIPTVYNSLPQLNCVKKSREWMWELIDESKSLLNRTDGIVIPIGNVTSQNMANFCTTDYLFRMDKIVDAFVHYTDDNKGIVKDKMKFLKSLNKIKEECYEKDHLIIHPKKFDIQHYSKGSRIGAYKIKFNRILPNDRIAHNFIYKINKAIKYANADRSYIYKFKEDFMSTMNSYLGLLKHCNAYKLKKENVDKLKNSKWKIVFDFADDYSKVNIKKEYSKLQYYIYHNKKRKKKFLELKYQLTCI